MQSRSRLLIASALVALAALAVAACGTSATAPPTSTPPASAAATSVAPAASIAPADSAAPAGSSAASQAPADSVAPTASPTAEQQALIDLLPKKLGPLDLAPRIVDAPALINAAPDANKGLTEFLASIGVTPKDLLIVFAIPTSKTNIPISIGAYRFVGADPASLKDKFIKTNLAGEPGSSVKEEQIGGRTVTALLAPANNPGPPVYLVFSGDTVFVGSSTDATTAADIVASFPK
jgi:hypothetical protein